MKRLLKALLVICTLVLFSCGGGSSSSPKHPYAGTFTTQDRIKFELKNDSTALISFPNGKTYDSTWKIVKNDDQEWVNIEFLGNQEYFYLQENNIYHSRRDMDHKHLPNKVTYQD